MMKHSFRSAGIALAVLGLISAASEARAANWVKVGEPSVVNIDADSIRKGVDGLVYFDAEDDMGVSPSAVDCAGQIFYVVGIDLPDWKANPFTIKPGSPTAKEAEFVCSRV
jgi:hypothetical protein